MQTRTGSSLFDSERIFSEWRSHPLSAWPESRCFRYHFALIIDVSHNCGSIFRVIFVFLRPKMPVFDRESPMRKRRFCRISHF